jgi:hypothetical protein
MEENDWQPVLLASLAQILKTCPRHLRRKDLSYWPKPKRVRVRPTGNTNLVGCKTYQIHPSDDFGPPGYICEHQILAD